METTRDDELLENGGEPAEEARENQSQPAGEAFVPADEEEPDEENENDEPQGPTPMESGERFRVTIHRLKKDYLRTMLFNYYVTGLWNSMLQILAVLLGLAVRIFGLPWIISIVCWVYPAALFLLNWLRFRSLCQKNYPTARVFDLIGNDDGFLEFSHQTHKTTCLSYADINKVVETKNYIFITAKARPDAAQKNRRRFQIICPKRELPKNAYHALKNLVTEHLTFQQYRFKKLK